MKTSTIACAAMLVASRVCGALDPPTLVVRDEMGTLAGRQTSKAKQEPSTFPLPNSPTPHGCYKSGGNMTTHTVENMSSGSCNEVCKKGKFPVSGLQGPQCYCGFVYPPASDVVEDGNCNYPCPSYPLEACGGLGNPGHWSVYNTGVTVNVGDYEPASSSSSSSSSDPTRSSTTDSDSTAPAIVTQTRTARPSAAGDEVKSGPNTAPIVAGSVAGVVAAALLIGGIFFFIRRRRNSEIEEEHRRNAAVNAFINGSKPPGSSGSMSMTDSRLDPVLAHRRMSDGSIADNEDYSRRILRVTNA
ncbi:WSC domain-containing protein [Hirsutella rhossiliensis]|uniref:WSC domain-containing protein n=1 Tax=Hirsutella rhossiliensis TaxID=111463 RepID=A0A9P8N0H4_9HYPO|nr:WSC domain-containing protein [Hirsutella rhossiliensis]KAH0964645.1 WSC domain-containing protein [Hirsutella rhossiliensis]